MEEYIVILYLTLTNHNRTQALVMEVEAGDIAIFDVVDVGDCKLWINAMEIRFRVVCEFMGRCKVVVDFNENVVGNFDCMFKGVPPVFSGE